MAEDWRIEVDAIDHFRAQKKRVATDQRRPSIRKASDLVGPGIDATAVAITNFNDQLATFNGYYSAVAGALYAPNSTDSFIGNVVMDSLLGGVQEFTSLVSGKQFTRVFRRSPSDENTIAWGQWTLPETVPATVYATESATGTSVHVTELEAEETTVLEMPEMAFVGDPDTYSRSTSVLNILRSGMYTGHLWIRTVDNSFFSTLQIEYPTGPGQTYDALYSVASGVGVLIPLTFYTSETTGFIRVTATLGTLEDESVPSTECQFIRLHLIRVGDAP